MLILKMKILKYLLRGDQRTKCKLLAQEKIYESKSADLGAKPSLAEVMRLCRGEEQIVAEEEDNTKCTSNENEIRAKKGKLFIVDHRNDAISIKR